MGELFSVGLLTASLIVNRVFKSIDFLSGGCLAHLLMNVRSEMCMGFERACMSSDISLRS